MFQKALSILKYVFLLSFGIALLYFAFKDVDFIRMQSELEKAHFGWVLLSLACCIAAHYSRAVRWNMLIKTLGYTPSNNNTFAAVMAGYLANLAIPRMGELTRCGALNQTNQIPFDKLVGTVVAERVFDLLMLICSIGLAILIEYDIIGSFLSVHLFAPLATKWGAITHSPTLLLLLLGIVLIIIVLGWILYIKRNQIPLFSKIVALFTGIAQGVKAVLTMQQKLAFLLHTLFIWVMYFFMSYLCFFAIAPTSHLGFKAGLFTLVTGGIGMTAPVQGGIGVYHLMVSQGLTLFDIPAQDGLVYATIVHTSQTILILLAGGLALLYLFFIKRRAIQHESSN